MLISNKCSIYQLKFIKPNNTKKSGTQDWKIFLPLISEILSRTSKHQQKSRVFVISKVYHNRPSEANRILIFHNIALFVKVLKVLEWSRLHYGSLWVQTTAIMTVVDIYILEMKRTEEKQWHSVPHKVLVEDTNQANSKQF